MVGSDRSNAPNDGFAKQALKGRYIEASQVNDWLSKIETLVATTDAIVQSAEERAIEPIHDAKRWSKELSHNSEALVQHFPGQSFRQKLHNANPEVRNIVKSSRILGDIFESMRLYNNPRAAAFQEPEPIEVYRVLDKIVSILQAGSDRQDSAPVKLTGHGYGTYRLRQSFQLIPLALIQNAQQYLARGEVEVHVDENDRGMKVEVSNVGPLMLSEEQQNLYSRGTRGMHGSRWKRDGTGLGLYIAQVAAAANGIQLDSMSTPLSEYKGDVPLAENRFWFVIR